MASNSLFFRKRGIGFPKSGRPGFDPNHPCAANTKLSAVFLAGNFFNYAGQHFASSVGGTTHGTVASKIDGIIGPCKDVGTSYYVSFASGANAALQGITLAAIIRTGASDNAGIFTTSATAGSQQIANFGALQFSCPGIDISSGITLAANTPYFVACSSLDTGNTTNVVTNFVAVNLITGAVTLASDSPRTFPMGSGSTGYSIGNEFKYSTFFQGRIAAVMHSTQYLTPAHLAAWGGDPWSFWYPVARVGIDPLYGPAPSGPAAAGPGRTAPNIFRPRQGPSRGLWTPRSTFIPPGTTASGGGASAGVGTVTGVGAALFAGQGASTGVGTVTGVGAALFNGQGASAGVGTAAATGKAVFNAVASSAGTGTAAAVGDDGLIIPASRRVAWKPGVTYNGGIPSRTSIFTTLSPIGGSSDDTAQINSAITSAGAVATSGSPKVVLLSAGLFNITGAGIFLNKSFVTLRGAGLPPAMATGGNFVNDTLSALNYVSGTWLQKSDRQTNRSGALITFGRVPDTVQSPLLSTLLTADAAKDAFSCTVTSTTGMSLSVGKLVIIDHNTNSDPNVFWNTHDGPGADFMATISGTTMTVTSIVRGTISAGTLVTGNGVSNLSGNTAINAFGTGGTSGTGGTGTYSLSQSQTVGTSTFMTAGFPTRRFFCRQDRSISQLMEISAISGNVITFATPFYYTFTTANSAQLTTIDETNYPIMDGCSVENLGCFGGLGGDGFGNIAMGLAKNSWIKNVEAYFSGGTNIGLYGTYRCEVRDSFMHETVNPNPGGDGYQSGFNVWASDCLYENCIMWVGNKETVSRGSGGGNVKGYCYMDDAFGSTYPEAPEAGVNAGHFATPYMELLEGNYSQGYKGDDFWGNSIYITVHRNWLSGIRGCSPTGGAPSITPCNNLRAYTTVQGGTTYPYGDYEGRTIVDNQAYCYFGNFTGNVLGFSGQTLLTYSSATYNATQTTWVYEQLDRNVTSPAEVTAWSFGALALTTSGFSWVTGSYAGQLRQGNWTWNGSTGAGTQDWHGVGGSYEYGGNPSGPFPSIPNSYYQSAKPAFFGGYAWPWVDPTTGATATLPAKARFDANTPNVTDVGNVAASSGTGTATGIGRSLAASAGASAGAGAAAGIGLALAPAVGATAGVGAATAIGASLVAAVAATSGTGTALGVGSFTVPGNVGTSAGIGTATGIGAWTADGIAASAGAGTALGVGQASGLISAVGSSAGISIVLGVSPAVEQPAGGAGYVMRSHSFTRKRWEELQALIAAERAAAAKAEKVGNPARAEALKEASGKAQDAISALEGVEEQDAYQADMERLRARLAAATSAKNVADSIRAAKEAALLAEKLQAEADEEYEIMLLMDDGPEAAREMQRIVAMMASITRP